MADEVFVLGCDDLRLVIQPDGKRSLFQLWHGNTRLVLDRRDLASASGRAKVVEEALRAANRHQLQIDGHKVEKLLTDGAARLVKASREKATQVQHRSTASLEKRQAHPDDLLETARSVLEAPDQLKDVQEMAWRLGYAGDTAAVELLHLAVTSRFLDRPINVQVEGPSAGGKTYTVETALNFHPPGVVHDLTAMSERALAYTDFETRHRFVLIGEASALFRDGVGATIVRALAWGDGIRYEFVEKTKDGLRARVIEKPGPTGLITTTTRPLEPEISTRLLRVHISDSSEQTRAVLRSLARTAAGDGASEPDLTAWHAAQVWLEQYGCRRVVVPFAEQLAGAVPADEVRMRRDFEQILTVVRASALLHQRTRNLDAEGCVVAERRDYETAYRLLRRVLAVTLDSVSDETRQTVAAVRKLTAGDSEAAGVSYPQLAAELGLSRSGAWRRAEAALKAGYLVNAEERRGYPARLVPGEPVPDDRPILPTPDELFAACTATTPLRSAQQLNTHGEEQAAEPETGAERGNESPEVLSQSPSPAQHPTQHPRSHGDGENSGGVEGLSGKPGGDRRQPVRRNVRRRTGRVLAFVCPSCGGGMEAGRQFCGTCTFLKARRDKGNG